MSLLDRLNRAIVVAAAIATIAAALVLTYSVAVRYFFKVPTDWQDEMAAFLLIGVTFTTSAWVQSTRGHVAIEAVSAILPPRANAVRLYICDVISLLFCGFFAWKSWTLLHEAITEHYVTGSSWAPPLWIPYLAMMAGMTLLTLQIALQMLRLRRMPAAQPAPQSLPH
ncbi:MAG: TRAP transporter small permease [Rhodospirillales bacterium]